MKFVKGIIIGSCISAGAVMLYTETKKNGTKKLMKQGKRFIKNMGIM